MRLLPVEGDSDDLQFMALSNCHVVSVPWSNIAAAIPESVAANATQPALAAASEGKFKVVNGTSEQFSGKAGLCGTIGV